MKKGQVSLYVAIGLLVLILGLLLIYGKYSNTLKITNINYGDVQEVRDYIASCAEYSGKEAIFLVGLLGGYNEIKEDALADYVPYYYDKGEILVPGLSEIEQSISKQAIKEMNDCVDLAEFDFETELINEPNAKVTIGNSDVNVRINYDVKVRKNGKEYNLDEPYIKRYFVKFKESFEFAKQIIQGIKANPDSLTTKSLSKEGYEVVLNYYSDAIMFNLKNRDSFIDDENFIFKFGVRYY